MDKRTPVGCEFVTVLEEFQISLYVNFDLDEFGMAVDSDAIRFGLLDFNPIFKNDRFVVLSGIRHRNTLERLIVKRQCTREANLVRYADDFTCTF